MVSTSDPDPSLLTALNDGPVTSIADIGGTARDLTLAANGKWDCDIILVDLASDGGFPETPSDWVEPYRDFLVSHGVEPTQIHVVREENAIKPWDVIVSLSSFGDAYRVGHLMPIVSGALHSDSRMLIDIRKGSGGYPFLKPYGSCQALSQHDQNGVPVFRNLFTPSSLLERSTSDPGWTQIAKTLAGPDGAFRDNGTHSLLFVPRGQTLVVTFDNLDIAMNKREDRRPWGYSFIEKQGWSMLGVMANGWTWYRDPWVYEQFDQMAQAGVFKRFERVVFYGASMGGYAACAFSAACPGADVVAISPQSTLDKTIVPWETRYKVAWNKDFSGKYGDAAKASAAAGRVTLLFDPYEPLDVGHVDRFQADNVVKLRTPLMGHRLGSSLHQMGILNQITLGALDGTLSPHAFYRAIRARHQFPRYQKELLNRAIARGRPGLARKVGNWVLSRGENHAIRKALDELKD